VTDKTTAKRKETVSMRFSQSEMAERENASTSGSSQLPHRDRDDVVSPNQEEMEQDTEEEGHFNELPVDFCF